jgi:hypothetical protein
MPSYWWACSTCHAETRFEDEVEKGPVLFLYCDLANDWDQQKLVRKCRSCKTGSLRMAFHFPRKERERLTVVHIVGLTPVGDEKYLPMLWETIPSSSPDERWFHFNYMNGKSNWGLNKAAVFTAGEMKRLLDLYFAKTGKQFPSEDGNQTKSLQPRQV